MLVCETEDNIVRWREGERLDHLFEQRCDDLAGRDAGHLAVETEDAPVTFQELDRRANQVARHLIKQGVKSGDRIGLVFDKSIETYIALLAVLKVNAAYVPLDASFPQQRLAFIVKDAGVKAILSLSDFGSKLEGLDVVKHFLDIVRGDIEQNSSSRLSDAEKGAPVSQLCYVIYTSGTTGTPKGVAIEHASICNFVRVAGEVYGYLESDRVYQGMTIAFDFSVEELWVPLIAGATLIPGKPSTSLVGNDLADFLTERRVTALCCVPTLLATVEKDLPDLRFLLVSGEACPQSLVARWHRPGRTMLNAYGPTEATVTATLTPLCPGRAVTIGGPLPTYTIVILDEGSPEALPNGTVGEIGIAGVGLASGYLNQPDLTGQKFIPDFLRLPNNPSKRIYRTGDLGRINDQGEVEFLGRIDTQVKVRGYRIELGEIEAVLERLPQVGQAVVHTYEPEPGAIELVAYYTLKQGVLEPVPAEIAAVLRKQLPSYMVPAYFERLAEIPMTASNKLDRKNLPRPRGGRVSAGHNRHIEPRTGVERALADALAEVMKIDRISVQDHFFHDLGAHSLLMARFCSEIRRRLKQSAVSMRDVYLHPTIEDLATHLGSLRQEQIIQPRREPLRIPSRFAYFGCGALQLVYYAAYVFFIVALGEAGFVWATAAGHDALETYARFAGFSVATFALLTVIPVVLKWVLVGKWKPAVIPIWSLRYYRFWVVRTAIQTSPAAFLKGTPIYNWYLRLLGARIGRNTVIQTRFLPVCTDLISIGDNTILRNNSIVLGYKAQANYLYTGPVRIGDNAVVGEASVLDIDTAIGDDGQLGHASSLQSGQRIPAGRRYHGSPAQETHADYRLVEGKVCSSRRRVLYSLFLLAGVLAVVAPALALAAYYGFALLQGYAVEASFSSNAPWLAFVTFSGVVAVASFLLVGGALLGGLIVVFAVPRVLNSLLASDKTYVLYGFHYLIHQAIAVISWAPFFNFLFGDSSFIVYYLRWVGYRLNRIVQTGSNFGLDQQHDNPFLCDIGSGSMVSDGLQMINISMSSSSFALRTVRIGENNYLGNKIVFPAQARTGTNCLLATKVMIPIDGCVRENVGLLGSPSFEIPRIVERDKQLKLSLDDKARRRLVRRKMRTNAATVALLLFSMWVYVFALLLALHYGFANYSAHGLTSVFVFLGITALFSISYFAFLERASLGFGRLRPSVVSMYDPHFFFHERHWKFCGSPLIRLFRGTPFKNMISRLLGVRLGRRVFDDGCVFYDKTLIEVGDYANLNEFATFQGHSLEEGIFKSDHVKVGDGCTIGCGALVHYGVTLGGNVVIDPDSFVMKGEQAEDGTTWRGNPAKLIVSPAGHPAMEASQPQQAAVAE